MRKDIWHYVKTSKVFQRYKPKNTKPNSLLQSTEVPEPGHTVGLGLFPLRKQQNAYLLVVAKWVEMFTLREIKTQKLK